MGRARIGLVVVVLVLALAPSVAFADVPVSSAAQHDAGSVALADAPVSVADSGAGDPDYGAGDSKYDSADPPYGAVAWAEPDPTPPGSDPGSDPARSGSDPARSGSDPARLGSDPERRQGDPARSGSDPARHGSDPVRREPDPAQPGADPARPASASCSAGTVALTFDDGPGPYTSRVLDLLAKYRVRATFFVIGEQIQARPGLVRLMAARGHHVQNHTWSHPNLVTLSADRVRTELSRTTAAITAAGAPRPTQARPPYGAMSAAVLKIMTAQRLTPIKWTIDTNDWRGLSPTRIRSTVLDELQPGAVVLMHDGLPTARNTLQALPDMITGIRAAGYCFGFPRAHSTAPH